MAAPMLRELITSLITIITMWDDPLWFRSLNIMVLMLDPVFAQYLLLIIKICSNTIFSTVHGILMYFQVAVENPPMSSSSLTPPVASGASITANRSSS